MADSSLRSKRRASAPIPIRRSASQRAAKRLRLESCEPPELIIIDDSSSESDSDLEIINKERAHQQDACFGILLTTAISAFRGKKAESKQTAVSVESSERILKLSYEETGEYAGLVKNDVLAQLLQKYQIKFRATLNPPTGEKKKAIPSFRSKFKIPEECELRIAVYGSMSDAQVVGDALGDSNLCFQHPLTSDLDAGMGYHNPHYLRRPGSEFPSLERLDLGDNEQKSESGLIDEHNKAVIMKLFDEAAHTVTESQISSSPRLKSALKEHQLIALTWLSKMESPATERPNFPSLWELLEDSSTTEYRHKITGLRSKTPGQFCGGILADEMGLGKTMSILALVCGSLDAQDQVMNPNKRAKEAMSTLIITPKSTIHNWIDQCERHIHPGKLSWTTYHGSNRERSFGVLQKFDVVLTTYGTMRRDWIEKGPIYSGKWRRVVLDEAHHIRSRTSQTHKAACDIDATRRWCVTGTPIQNSLDDLGSLARFIRVPKLMDKKQFDSWITSPTKADHPDSLRRLGVLIKATCLRRTKQSANMALNLPRRAEKVVWADLTKNDRELYTFFEKKAASIASGLHRQESKISETPDQKESNILALINFLRLICDGGESLLPRSAITAWENRIEDSISWEVMQAIDGSGSNQEEKKRKKKRKPSADLEIVSPKLRLLIENIRQEQSVADDDRRGPVKSVVFSSWTKMLDLVQEALDKTEFNIQRVDGQTSLQGRQTALREFRENPECTVLLASIGSAGEGIDLTIASNVHLLEPSWNPMAESQAVDRIHRIGQHRDVLTTRYMTRNSIETYIQWVQQDKLRLIERSLDSSVSSSTAVEHRIEKLQQVLRCKKVR